MYNLPKQEEESNLSEFTEGSKVFKLHPDALRAWRKMKEHAKMDGIDLELVSAFRSKERQQEIIDRKLERGEKLDQVYSVNCPAGYSEHHTGRAIDLGTPGYPVLEQEFDQSDAFTCLEKNGRQFGFRMSYPRNNRHGIVYEPWHWFYIGDQVQQVAWR